MTNKEVVVDLTNATNDDMIEECKDCNGTGYLDNGVLCHTCHGLGKVLTEKGKLYLKVELAPVEGSC